MNFNIAKVMDENKLLDKIYEYIHLHNDDPYIFMNKNTINNLIEVTTDDLAILNREYVAMFRGYKIFCDNTKSYGEVELR